MKSGLNLELVDPDQITLEEKVTAFKADPTKLKEAEDFVDDLLQNAKVQAEKKLVEKERSKQEALLAEQGLKRRIGTRARGFIVRVFEAICNCTNTGGIARVASTPSKNFRLWKPRN